MSYKILIVDDLKSIYNNINSLLTPKGCEVVYKSDGYEGLKEAKINKYDLIILDIHMPGINGLEVCKQIKSVPYYHLRPILLLTSDTKSLEKGLLAGASDYILKPFNKLEMTARVFTQLNLSKERLANYNEKENLENNLSKERERLLEAQDDLRKYFYQTAHKLRSPIKTMQGLLSLVETEHPEMYHHIYVEKLYETVQKLDYINSQISLIGELKAVLPDHKEFELKECIEELIADKFANSNIRVDIPSKFNIYTDFFSFVNGVIPLINNAVFFSSLSRKNVKEISISLIEEYDDFILSIKDEGPGIPEESLDKIFNMFFVGNNYSGGNGLGLFISKVALNKLKIDVEIQSIEGVFTTAKLKLNRYATKKASGI